MDIGVRPFFCYFYLFLYYPADKLCIVVIIFFFESFELFFSFHSFELDMALALILALIGM